MLKFEWDENKNARNKSKHGISFEEAKDVLSDEDALLIFDHKHSLDEDRFLMVGMAQTLNVITVVFCIRELDTFRIISARRATKNEREEYEKRKFKNTLC